MKKTSKIIAILLCASICFQLVACKSNGSNDSDATKPIGTVTQTEELKGKDGLHKISVSPSDNVFVNADATTEYTIVYPKNCHSRVPAIAATFARNIGLATDASVSYKEESNEVWSEDAKYIVLGDCALFTAAGLTLPTDEDALGKTGVYIKTVGKSVFLNAEYWLGLNNATFVFLEHVLGHKQIYDTAFFTVEKGKAVTLPTMEIIERPDFEFADYTTNFSGDYGLANRLSDYDMFMELEGSGDTIWHNSFNWVNSDARQKNPKWVSEDRSQLCYTAHGDADAYKAMLEHCLAYVMPSIEKNPDKNNVSFTHQDESSWCTCETCSKYLDAYGTDAATVVFFMKRLAKMINDEVHKTNPDRTITVWFFAYHTTEKAPAVKNAEGQYVPIEPQFTASKANVAITSETLSYPDDKFDSNDAGSDFNGVVCDESVGVYIAPINAKYTHKLTDDENDYMYNAIIGWEPIVSVKGAWLYSANFEHLYYPYNCFESIPNAIRLFSNLGARWIWNQGQGYGMTGFGAFKEYLNFKLYWNCNQDISDLRQEFFDGYYGAASEVMYKMYTEVVAHCRYIEENFDEISGGLYENLEKADMWPKGLLQRWEGYCNEALNLVNSDTTIDEDYRKSLVKNVVSESMFPRFALIRLYKTTYSAETLQNMQRSWKADADKYSFVSHQEHHTIEEVYFEWGLN